MVFGQVIVITINTIDPYHSAAQDWIADPIALHPLTNLDNANYLAFGLSAYTLHHIKSYKSLEAYEQFSSSCLQDLLIPEPANRLGAVILTNIRRHLSFFPNY